jgi:hypothetical protein
MIELLLCIDFTLNIKGIKRNMIILSIFVVSVVSIL